MHLFSIVMLQSETLTAEGLDWKLGLEMAQLAVQFHALDGIDSNGRSDFDTPMPDFSLG